jgi:hypothetical protein
MSLGEPNMLSALLRQFVIFLCVSSLLISPAFAQNKPAPKEKETAQKAADKASDKADKADKSDDKEFPDRKIENRTAQEIADLVKDLDYPELQVVPRASDRLRMEAREEGRAWFYQHWPIQLSGLATLVTATYGASEIREVSTTDTARNAAFDAQGKKVLMVGQLIGAGWFVGGILWGLRKPYRTGLVEISKVQGKDLRSQLMRERLAEETLESPAKLVKPLRYASVTTNLIISLLMGSFLSDEGRVVAAGAATLAFLPLIYEDPTMSTWEKHQEYKRKIYGPVSSNGFSYDRDANRFVPTATLSWNF